MNSVEMLAKLAVLLSVLIVFVCCTENIGLPAGFMSDCEYDCLWTKYGPGMNRSTTLSEETKNSLTVAVIKPHPGGFFNSFMAEKTCPVSVEGADCTAEHINLTKRKTQVVISGYLDSGSSPLVRSIVQTYLDRRRNVIVVEIFPLLVRSYPLAARITRPFGKLLGEYLAALTQHGLTGNRLELIGGSLGAHISGYAAERFRELTGRRPARVTGLDPAGPCFRNLPYSARLNHHVADRVDVLHTNIDGFGIEEPLGHVDFYANGGEYQQSIKKGFLLPCLSVCSHVRAGFYWVTASTHRHAFQAMSCPTVMHARHGYCTNETTNVLGPNTDFGKPGIYYLATSEHPPYYMGADGLEPRPYGSNTYLLNVAPDEDLVL